MGWYYNGFGWSFMWPVFWIVIGLLFWRFGHYNHSRRHHDDYRDSAKDILSERFAKGEIDEKEYEKRLNILKKHQ